jgi:hypothetical protein
MSVDTAPLMSDPERLDLSEHPRQGARREGRKAPKGNRDQAWSSNTYRREQQVESDGTPRRLRAQEMAREAIIRKPDLISICWRMRSVTNIYPGRTSRGEYRDGVP